jgi:predicted nucleic acid-binding protein
MKHNASFDASFWINICACEIVDHVLDYFNLYTTKEVAAEIRYPLRVLGIRSKSVILFNSWLEQNLIKLQDPKEPVSWFQSGENAAIALAIEKKYFLLIDDANPYHRAKSAGLQVVGSPDFTVYLYDQDRINHSAALEALKQMQLNKKLRKTAMVALETLKRIKEG